MTSKLLAMAAALTVAAGVGQSSQPASAAKKFTGCVKKSNGEMRLLLGKSKKCGKGWKKQTWTKAGPKGPPGATGAPNSFGDVVDANSAVVGEFMGWIPAYFGLLDVRIDGGLYTYLPNGSLYPVSDLEYDNASCSGTPFAAANTETLRDIKLGDVSMRLVYRTSLGGLGPATAYKLDGSAVSVMGLNQWYKDGGGVCKPDGALTGWRLPLTEVPAPPDHPGPLRIR